MANDKVNVVISKSLMPAYRQVMLEGFCGYKIQNPELGETECCLAPEQVRPHPVVRATGIKVHIDPYGYEVPYE